MSSTDVGKAAGPTDTGIETGKVPSSKPPIGRNGQTERLAPLSRPAYALRVGGCLGVLFGSAVVMGGIVGSMGFEPATMIKQITVFSLVANAVFGGAFVYLTYRRALDCRFGKNGWASAVGLLSLPTLYLTQYGLLIFAVMMCIKSAPAADIPEDVDSTPPFEPAE